MQFNYIPNRTIEETFSAVDGYNVFQDFLNSVLMELMKNDKKPLKVTVEFRRDEE